MSTAPFSAATVTRVWPHYPWGVPRGAHVVHATSMAGPFGARSLATGGVVSVALHDMLWRDEPTASTPAGIRFHDARLALILARERTAGVRLITTSPLLGARLVEGGARAEHVFFARLGVDDASAHAASPARVAEVLARHQVEGPFTFYAGTREPRKNVARLIAAHREARHERPDLGPLVLAGPPGWGEVDTADAVVLGLVDRDVLLGLYRDAAVCAYVATAEGWGLPPVEALQAGSRVVASANCPSVEENALVTHVNPLEVDDIARGLVEVLASPVDDETRAARRASVAALTWDNCARDHLAAWS